MLDTINLRGGTGGALSLFGHQETEGREVTTAPAMATATVSTLSLSAAALNMEASQITWSRAPPRWQQRTVAGRGRRW